MEICTRQAIVDVCVIDYKIRFVRQEIIQHQLLVLHEQPRFLLSSTESRIYRATYTYKDGAGMGDSVCFLLFLAI